MIVSRVSDIMRDKNETYQTLMKATELSRQTVRNARGPEIAKCRLQTLEAIAIALGVPVKALFEEVERA